MAEILPLPSEILCKSCDPAQFTFETTADLAEADLLLGQGRALDAMHFGVRIRGEGYNVYAQCSDGLEKVATVREIIAREAEKKPLPHDWCYVHNFAQPHKPEALRLPPGQGSRLRKDMARLVEELSTAITTVFESEEYRSRRDEVEEDLKERQTAPLDELREESQNQGIMFIETPTGFAFAPMNPSKEVLSPAQYNELPEAEQERIQDIVAKLQQRLQKILRQFPLWRKETKEKIKNLNREVARYAAGHLIDALKGQYKELPEVLQYLEAVREDIIDNVDEFRAHPEPPMPFLAQMQQAQAFQRYRVNLLVDHGGETAAPVIYEDLPNHANLIGRSEYQAQMGTLVTDFTLIKPGALHRANGGYLILEARKVLMQPYAWESLKRTLKSGELRIESLERTLSLVSTASLEPEPIPLDAKVVLVGDRYLYYLLYHYDPEFRELFKVSADFEESMDRTGETQDIYARLLGGLARREGLRPLDRGAMSRVIEQSARLTGDAEKLSTQLSHLTDLLREADYWADQSGRAIITRADVDEAIDRQIRRSDRIRERIYEEIRRGTILIDTAGEAVGQVNGLSVIDLGDFAFARPSRITAATHLGEGEIIDVERETELGGAIHSKGVLILSNFLASRYAQGHPLSMGASLVFEQSYGEVEGDSASLAELCAMLSSLADLPIRQSLAITGSVNQHGQVQPIGGVNEKVEGFFDVCRGTGLTGKQGVLIPSRNVKHLMLRLDVVKAAKEGRFRVYSVDTVDEALELLTGVQAGQRDAEGNFPEDSVNGRVQRRLLEFAAIRHSFVHGGDDKSEDPEAPGDG
jgi:lon-related putative ATP-dependent protease